MIWGRVRMSDELRIVCATFVCENWCLWNKRMERGEKEVNYQQELCSTTLDYDLPAVHLIPFTYTFRHHRGRALFLGDMLACPPRPVAHLPFTA